MIRLFRALSRMPVSKNAFLFVFAQSCSTCSADLDHLAVDMQEKEPSFEKVSGHKEESETSFEKVNFWIRSSAWLPLTHVRTMLFVVQGSHQPGSTISEKVSVNLVCSTEQPPPLALHRQSSLLRNIQWTRKLFFQDLKSGEEAFSCLHYSG